MTKASRAQIDREDTHDGTTSHPVRSFVIGLIVLALILLALQWSGTVNPQLSVSAGSSGNTSQREAYEILQVTNSGAFPVEVIGGRWSVPGRVEPHLFVGPPGETIDPQASYEDVSSPDFRPVDIAAGEQRSFMVRLSPSCADDAGSDPDEGELRLVVRTSLGITRTSSFTTSVQTTCGS